MTIPEACSLVLQTGGVGVNGASYLLDMGEPIKILDLAEQIIRFAGFEPYEDIDIKFIGTRPGERLVEPLWLDEEKPQPTDYQKILRLTNIPTRTFGLSLLVESLAPICTYTPGKENLYRNKDELLRLLRSAVPTLDDFYKAQEQDGKVVNMSNSVKVVL